MSNLSRRRLARELVRLMADQPAQVPKLLRQTAAYLVETKQAHQVHLLVNDIADELHKQQGHLNATVQSAFALSDTSRQKITNLLRQATGATAVELTEESNPHLLGGVVVRTPQLEMNASIQRHIRQLARGTP